jgi:hypothetical protein
MDDHGIDPDTRTIYFTSSMDFADENGFEHYDDAKILASEGFKLMSMTREEG